jgi:hypothetical protein
VVADEALEPVRIHGLGQVKIEARAECLALILGLPVSGEGDEALISSRDSSGARRNACSLDVGRRKVVHGHDCRAA